MQIKNQYFFPLHAKWTLEVYLPQLIRLTGAKEAPSA
jgi:hypothetical protein